MKKWWSTIIIASITGLYLAGLFQYLYPKKEMATEAAVNQQTSKSQNNKGKEKILTEFKILDENGKLSVPKPVKEKGSQQTPKAPEEVRIEGDYLSWHAVRDDGMIGYRIYRSDENGAMKHVGSVSAYERKTFTEKDIYQNSYYVTSIDQYGNESKPSKKATSKNGF